MSQSSLTTSVHTVGPVGPTFSAEFPQQIPTGTVFTILRRRKWLFLFVTVALSTSAASYILSLPAYYDGQALLMINTKQAAFRDLQATIETGGGGSDAIVVGTQVDVLRSPSMAETVTEQLDLVHVPEFTQKLDAPPSFGQQAILKIASGLGVSPILTKKVTGAERLGAVGALLQRAGNISNNGKSYIIEIRARTANPQLSAAIANAYANAYLDFNRRLKTDSIGRANMLVDEQIAPLQARVRRAEEAVEGFREKNGLVASQFGGGASGRSTTVADQQLAEISTQLIVASGDSAQKEASLRQVQAALKSGSIDTIPEVVVSPLIQSLREQEAALSSKEASLGESVLGNNPSLEAARAASSRLRDRIRTEISKIAQSMDNAVKAARGRQAALQDQLLRLQSKVVDQSQANVTLRELESEAQAARSVYQDYLARFEQTSTQGALQQPEANLISPAGIPFDKSGPARGELLGLAFVVSGVLGGIAALLAERLRGGLLTPEQLEAETGLFALGFVPRVSGGLRRSLQATGNTIYKESISSINSLLQFGDAQYRAKVVLVTSSSPKEGKTFLATSLAAGIGQEGGRALLIDCDLRRPSVAAALGLLDQPTDLAGHRGQAKAALRQGVLPGLDVVTFSRGLNDRRRLLDSEHMRALIDDARSRYDLIVLDTPPILAFADAPVLSQAADGAILVVSWRNTSSNDVAGALKTLRAYGVRVLGGVITQVNAGAVAAAGGGQARIYRNYANYFG